jgi:hypothetical protein
VRQGWRDRGLREGPTTSKEPCVKVLEREVGEVRQANEILELVSGSFAETQLDRRFKS